ncbi:MAG: hyalin, partial [Thiohalomonadales bacterium]
VTSSLKQLHFSWTQSSQVASYTLYVNPDGASGFTQVVAPDLTGTTFNLDIAAHKLDWMNAKYRVEACIKSFCTTSNELTVTDQMLDSIGYIKANNTGAGENFGSAVALSDDGLVMAVGAPRESSNKSGVKNTAIDSGAVYLFNRDSVTTNWIQQAFIKASNVEAGDLFGASVALSSDGKTLAVGAASEDSDQTAVFNSGNLPTSPDNNAAIDAGAAYVFTRDTNGAWNQQAYIKASNTGAGDSFGHVVSLSNDGNTLAVGAYNEDSLIPGIINDSINFPVPDLTETATTDAGAVYVFSRVTTTSTTNWVQQSYIKGNNQTISFNPSNPKPQDYFGYSVALSGNSSTIVVGAYGVDSPTTIDSGGAFIFTNDGKGVWSQQQNVFGPISNANYGWSVTINDNGNIMAIGAKDATVLVDGSIVGLVYLFKINSIGNWELGDVMNAPNPKTGDNFGAAVSMSGDGTTLAIGSSGEDGNSRGINKAFNHFAANAGAVYIFLRRPIYWLNKSYIKASNTDIDDLFGSSVVLSVDGSVLVVGAPGEAGASSGVTNNNITPDTQNAAAGAGAVYLY